MLFNSLHFFLFFPAVTAIYFLLPHRMRWRWLLAASCYFYMAFIPIYILILLFTIVIDYVAGIAIENESGRRRLHFLWISVAANVLVLAVFKYFNFFNENIRTVYAMFLGDYPVPNLGLVLPIGLSFHTFQSMSYTIEVYRGNQKAERHLGIFALYVMFYPQLVAGPIERPQNLLHQFRERHAFDYGRLIIGLQRMIWGFFKKMVVADRLAYFVNMVYNAPEHYRGAALVISTVFFAFQIYCDFSGYSDIAIGAAHVMGFTLMENFDRPYTSASVGEFWKRWHISLSTWFRDYLYIPLGGSRVSSLATYRNIFVTFVVSGLWHGAAWTYVIWGALNGTYIICAHALRRIAGGMIDGWRWLGRPITFGLICFSWIFFRANTTLDAFYIVGHLFDGWRSFFATLASRGTLATQVAMSQGKEELAIAVFSIVFLLFFERRRAPDTAPLFGRSWSRFAAYTFIFCAVLFLGKFNTSDFIYFQF
jgi:D-alanyl-lipoteichoic acid acyltransferase DltB (MBOAT superfamily)